MTRLPDESISFQNTTGDSGMENLYVYGKLNYNFENDDISLKSINASSTISTTATISAASYSGSGINLTNLPAEQLTGVLPEIDGSNLTGIESFVTGMIILWSGASDAIPTGFTLCDGQNNTPDLRGRFVVGFHDSNGDYDVDDTGGAESVTLTLNQIPAHKHDTTFDNKKYFPGGGSTSISFGGAGGYPADTFSMSNAGGGQSHENRPPFYALCYIMKT